MSLHVTRAFALSIALLAASVFLLAGCAEMQEKAQEKYVLVKEKVQEQVRVIKEKIRKMRGLEPAPPPPKPPEVVAVPAPVPEPPAAPGEPAKPAPVPAPVAATGISLRANCSGKDETGYTENIQLDVSNGTVNRFDARIEVPRRGSCKFGMAEFRQTRTAPHVEMLARSGSECAVRIWQQNERVTAAVSDCSEMCTRGAFEYVWPIELDAQTGSCM